MPRIPDEFHAVIEAAVEKAQQLEEIPVPHMKADLCVVNFYEKGGRLGLHQDKDETQDSLTKGVPVVSFSIGDDAEFLFHDTKRADQAQKITLKSGDVLIMGGESRMLYHGVKKIKLNSAPTSLINATHLRPGRLNLTFRKY